MTRNHADSGYTPFQIGQVGGESPDIPEPEQAGPVVNERTDAAQVGVQADEISSIDLYM